jgi:hypothetical protein
MAMKAARTMSNTTQKGGYHRGGHGTRVVDEVPHPMGRVAGEEHDRRVGPQRGGAGDHEGAGHVELQKEGKHLALGHGEAEVHGPDEAELHGQELKGGQLRKEQGDRGDHHERQPQADGGARGAAQVELGPAGVVARQHTDSMYVRRAPASTSFRTAAGHPEDAR